MNKQELENILKNELLGERYDARHNACIIAHIIKEKYPQYAGNIWTDYIARENVCFVLYRAHRLIGWKVQKTKGDYRRFLGYEWIIKNVTLFDWDFNDLQDRFNKIDNDIKTSEQNAQEQERQDIENFKKIRALFPALGWFAFDRMLTGVRKVCYDQIKKEDKDNQ